MPDKKNSSFRQLFPFLLGLLAYGAVLGFGFAYNIAPLLALFLGTPFIGILMFAGVLASVMLMKAMVSGRAELGGVVKTVVGAILLAGALFAGLYFGAPLLMAKLGLGASGVVFKLLSSIVTPLMAAVGILSSNPSIKKAFQDNPVGLVLGGVMVLGGSAMLLLLQLKLVAITPVALSFAAPKLFVIVSPALAAAAPVILPIVLAAVVLLGVLLVSGVLPLVFNQLTGGGAPKPNKPDGVEMDNFRTPPPVPTPSFQPAPQPAPQTMPAPAPQPAPVQGQTPVPPV